GATRMTRGRCGSLPLHRNGLSPSTFLPVSRRTAAQWLAYTLPYRRFAVILAEDCTRIRGDVGCYSFIAVDSHHILLAGHSLALAPAPSRGPQVVTAIRRLSGISAYETDRVS